MAAPPPPPAELEPPLGPVVVSHVNAGVEFIDDLVRTCMRPISRTKCTHF